MNWRRERKLKTVAAKVVDFYYEYDPYGFMDSTEVGETVDETKARMVENYYTELVDGNYQLILDEVYDPDLEDPQLRVKMLDIIESIKKLKQKK